MHRLESHEKEHLIELIASGLKNGEIIKIFEMRGKPISRSNITYYRNNMVEEIEEAKKYLAEEDEVEVWDKTVRARKLVQYAKELEKQRLHLERDKENRLVNTKYYLDILREIGIALGDYKSSDDGNIPLDISIVFKNMTVDELWPEEKPELQDGNIIDGQVTDESSSDNE